MLGSRNGPRICFIIDIIPLQQRCKLHRFSIFGQIMLEYLFDMKVIRKLKGQGRIIDLLALDFFNIDPRAHFVRIIVIIWDTAAGNNTFEIHLLTELLPRIVKTTSKAKSTMIRMNKNLYSIQGIPPITMFAKLTVINNLIITIINIIFFGVQNN